MDSKIELIFQKNIGLGKRKESTARFSLFQEKEIIIKISGNKYYNIMTRI
jgi:ribosomal protein S9